MEENFPFASMPATSTPTANTMAILLVFLFSTTFEIFSRAGFEYILSLPWKQVQQLVTFGYHEKSRATIHPAPLDDNLNTAGVVVDDFSDSEDDSYLDQLEAGQLLAEYKPDDTDIDDAEPLKILSLRQRIWETLSHGLDYAATYLLMIIAMCKNTNFFHAAVAGHAFGRFVKLTVDTVHKRMELRQNAYDVADHHTRNHIAITIPPAEAAMV